MYFLFSLKCVFLECVGCHIIFRELRSRSLTKVIIGLNFSLKEPDGWSKISASSMQFVGALGDILVDRKLNGWRICQIDLDFVLKSSQRSKRHKIKTTQTEYIEKRNENETKQTRNRMTCNDPHGIPVFRTTQCRFSNKVYLENTDVLKGSQRRAIRCSCNGCHGCKVVLLEAPITRKTHSKTLTDCLLTKQGSISFETMRKRISG